jgi:ATP-dependent Clp protease ATP-binding subunit ClpA
LREFHGVVISDETVELVGLVSGRLLRRGALLDLALDLLDEASARVKLRLDKTAPDIASIKARLCVLKKDIDDQLANYTLKTCVNSTNNSTSKKKHWQPSKKNTKATKNRTIWCALLNVLAGRTGLSPDAVKVALARLQEANLRSVVAARIPASRRDCIDGLLAYLTDCSPNEADHLVKAIGEIRKTL